MLSETQQTAKIIFEKYKRIAVIGISPEPSRPSYGVSQYLTTQGFDVIGVRPGGIKSIETIKVYENLKEVPKPIEIVDVFRNSEAVPQIVDEAIEMGAKVLWLQEGVHHPIAEEKARNSGMLVISDACILKLHKWFKSI